MNLWWYDILNILILLTGVTVTVLSLELMCSMRPKWYLFLPLFIWGGHLTVFYCAVIYSGLIGVTLDVVFKIPGLFSWWSTLQRFHGVITMLFMTILLSVEIKHGYFKYELEKTKENKNISKEEE